jgi:tetratricopeptide (TPR) repeat protein
LLEQQTSILPSYFTATEESFYNALIHLARYSKVSSDEQSEILQRVNFQQEKLKFWASHAPCNHQHKWELVAAEQYRVLGQRLEAIDYYDRAIASAKDNGFLCKEALANELAAKFYLNWGKEKIAKVYLQEAYRTHLRSF